MTAPPPTTSVSDSCPQAASADPAAIGWLGERVRIGGVVVLTGAGMSTDSGIPDYRGPGKPPRTPMTYGEFVSGPDAQRRYWARAHVGWGHMSGARPNAAHLALRDLQRGGRLGGLITQNVDGLHEASGHRDVVALHGRIDSVVCLRCDHRSDRGALHGRLERLNPGYADQDVEIAPDGDALLDETASFVLAPCLLCGGALKPDVVFFGESVPKPRVAACFDLVQRARTLLVVGSSLQVMSGLRFVRAAARADIPVVVVNRGRTRGDDLATAKIDAGCAETLLAVAASP